MSDDRSSAPPGSAAVRPVEFPTPAAMGERVASMIVDGILKAKLEERRYLLGCPSGRTPVPVYVALAAMAREFRLDLRNVVLVMMDEYVEPDESGALRPVHSYVAHSCTGFAHRQIRSPLNEAVDADQRMPAGNVWVPDPRDPESYDAVIEAAGGIDLFLLATGASDGHIAFNPPGSDRDSRTRVVQLSSATRQDNMSTFPSFGSLDEVPLHGVTVGIATIREQSRGVVMMAHGPDKASAVERIRHANYYDPGWPATVLVECRAPHFFVDSLALDPEVSR